MSAQLSHERRLGAAIVPLLLRVGLSGSALSAVRVGLPRNELPAQETQRTLLTDVLTHANLGTHYVHRQPSAVARNCRCGYLATREACWS